jgi:hypothetical protein
MSMMWYKGRYLHVLSLIRMHVVLGRIDCLHHLELLPSTIIALHIVATIIQQLLVKEKNIKKQNVKGTIFYIKN